MGGSAPQGTDANGQAEDRGLLTKLVDSAAGTFIPAYDGDGKIIREVCPLGLTATWAYDNAGEPTRLTYAQDGQTWQNYTAAYNPHGRIITAAGPLTSQTYADDSDGRLTQAQDPAPLQPTNRLLMRVLVASGSFGAEDSLEPFRLGRSGRSRGSGYRLRRIQAVHKRT